MSEPKSPERPTPEAFFDMAWKALSYAASTERPAQTLIATPHGNLGILKLGTDIRVSLHGCYVDVSRKGFSIPFAETDVPLICELLKNAVQQAEAAQAATA